ncbi:MAG TPA: radical SAM protein [bacterium]|nr:radical SAM protein [bacterium]
MRRERAPSEVGAIHKDPGGKLNVLLVFPNSYFVGMSNLGFHAIYAALNSLDYVRCERSFLPEGVLRAVGRKVPPPRSLESGDMPSRFDVIAFAVPFENDYPNLVRFLKLAGLKPRRDERWLRDPLVLAGGCAVSANPEPLASFVDAFVIGDGEQAVQELARAVFDARQARLDRQDQIARLAEIPGVYIPGLFEPEYGTDGTVSAVRSLNGSAQVARRWTPKGELVPAHTVVFSEETEFGDLGVVEAVRGCPRACAFCMVSFCNRPVRFLSVEQILSQVAEIKRHRQRVGLLGSAVAEHPELLSIVEGVLSMGMGVTVSSLRADSISPQLLSLLTRGGQRTITIAPETGDAGLRAALGKPITDEALIDLATQIASAGFETLKLYFIVGLPGESLKDVEKIVSLVKQMKHGLRKRSLGKRDVFINVSVSSFVPKAHTPFQWEAMLPPSELARRIKVIETGLSGTRGVSVHADVPKWAFVQGVLSRGDRRISKLVSSLAETNFNWQRSREMIDVNPEFFALRTRSRDEILPWAHIASGVPLDELWRRLESYRAQTKEADSR